MEYKMFEVDFGKWSRDMTFECDNVRFPSEQQEVYVRDGYADHDSFGFYIGDAENAFDHARSMVLAIVRSKKEEKPSGEYQKKLIEDVRNYLGCCFTWEEEAADDVVILIKYMARLGMEEELHRLLMDYYHDYVNDRDTGEKENYTIPLDFQYLYISIGDKALLEKQDSRLAMMYYGMAALEWERKDTNRTSPQKRGRMNWEDLKNWPAMMEVYRSITGGNPEFRETYMERREEEEYWHGYLEMMEMLAQWEDEAAVVERSDSFFRMAEQFLDTRLGKQYLHLMRTVLLMAHKVYAECLLPAMACLQQEKKAVREHFRRSVLDGLLRADNPSLDMLKKYRMACEEEQSCLDDLLLLARETIYISRVQRLLLVGEEDDGQEIAYYTALPTFCYMLPGVEEKNPYCGKMSIMNIAYMNDPNEGKILQRYLGMGQQGDISGKVPMRRNAIYPYVFMKCFTSLVDDLPMWEMYGDHAGGCCIILDRKCFVSKAGDKKAIPLYRICYLKKRGASVSMNKEDNPYIRDLDKLRGLLKEVRKGILAARAKPFLHGWLEKMLEDIVYLFKDADYRHEQEVRILYRFHEADDAFFHTPGEYPLLYVHPEFSVDIREIILGPKFEKLSERMPYLTEQVEKMCRVTGGSMPKITISSIEYR